jgi:hypothetical protein
MWSESSQKKMSISFITSDHNRHDEDTLSDLFSANSISRNDEAALTAREKSPARKHQLSVRKLQFCVLSRF